MVNKICDSPIHKAFATVLAFIIFSLCFLPLAVSADSVYPNTPVGWKDGDTFRDIIAVVLDSWGISFSSNGGNLSDDMDMLLQEFYDSQDALQDEFWRAAQIGVNKLGQILLDNTTLGKVIQFARWLINEYNLSDNQVVDTTPSSDFYLGNIPVYQVPALFTGGGYGQCGIASATSPNPAYAVWIYTSPNNTTYAAPYVFSSTDSSFTAALWRFGGPWTNIACNSQVNNWFYGYYGMGLDTYYSRPPADMILPYGYDIVYALSVNSSVTGNPSIPSVVITTEVISIPTPVGDDGLVVTVPDAEWGMTLFEVLNLIERLIGLYDNTQLEIISVVDTLEDIIANLQTDVSVNNIPGGVVLDYDDYDIPIENEWGLFDVFFNTGGDEIILLRPWRELRDIIYGFPAPVLSFFALVVLFIVAYGFIRMGRDSH